MTVQDSESQGTAPFNKETSEIVKRQYGLHHKSNKIIKKEKKHD